MYKMLFDTGVKPHNHPFLREHEEWVNGTLRIAFYLESAPPKGAILRGLCDEPEACYLKIPVVGGGMLSKFAFFTVYEPAKVA